MVEVWPGKPSENIERTWAPFWSLYTRDRAGNAVEDELLWGLYRYRRDDGGTRKFSIFPFFCYSDASDTQPRRRWSVLLGLAGYEREGLQKTLRLLYFPLRWGSEADAPAGLAAAPGDSLPLNRGVKESEP
jgi:hypothetical protein